MFDAHLAFRARQQPRAIAVITKAGHVSYADFDADVTRLGRGLLELGIAPGRSVSIQVGNSYLQFVTLMALGRIGVISAPSYDTAADVALSDTPENIPIEADGVMPVLRLSRDWLRAMYAAEPAPLPRPDYDPEAIGRIMLSSGTTKEPRRIGLTWRRIEAGIAGALRSYAADKKGVWVPVVGAEAMLGHSQALTGWTVGAAVVNGFTVADLLPAFEAWEPGIMAMTPIQLRQLLARLPAGFRARPGWRITTAGSVLPPAVARDARLRITPDIQIIYGATEAGLSATGHAIGLESAPNLLGYPPPGAEAQVVDEAGFPVPPGEPGELKVRGERTVAGYLDDPEATAERFRDGWFHTHDIVRQRPDGLLVIEGRVDDRMNLGGQKFMPSVLEDAAFDCPGVYDAAAFAVPDEYGLDVCWLAVSVAPDFDRPHLASHLAKYPGLPPNRFAWIEEIPRNNMGKVERAKLRAAVLLATRGDAAHGLG